MPRTCYIWDGDNILMEKDDTGQTTAEYTYNPKPHGELISQRHKVGMSWQTRYHEFDAIGSTKALTDETGAVTDTYQYDAWGNQISTTGSSENPFRWVGKLGYYWDAELGTYYIRRRTYQPQNARWLSEDLLLFHHGILNAYVYVYNSSTRKVDPSGLEPEKNGTKQGNAPKKNDTDDSDLIRELCGCKSGPDGCTFVHAMLPEDFPKNKCSKPYQKFTDRDGIDRCVLCHPRQSVDADGNPHPQCVCWPYEFEIQWRKWVIACKCTVFAKGSQSNPFEVRPGHDEVNGAG